ncbi:MAG: hypothetical protein IIB38_12095, partial [Candidatus Hydrogenedentes bacterium]|nr:hypothetical protein [Candidatus Hydrogenedentota bacterium]
MSVIDYENEISPSSVTVRGDLALVEREGRIIEMPLQSLPEDKIAWIEEGRGAAYDRLLDNGSQVLRSASYHLPMVTTYSADAAFPFNCCNKGVGYIPKREYLDEFIELFRNVHEYT